MTRPVLSVLDASSLADMSEGSQWDRVSAPVAVGSPLSSAQQLLSPSAIFRYHMSTREGFRLRETRLKEKLIWRQMGLEIHTYMESSESSWMTIFFLHRLEIIVLK